MSEWRIDVLVTMPGGRKIMRHVYAKPLSADSPMFKEELDKLSGEIELAVQNAFLEPA